jgi:hypothetical protein
MSLWVPHKFSMPARLFTYMQDSEYSFHCQWKEIVRIMNTPKVVTTSAQKKPDEVILIRRCPEPNDKVKLIYDKLNLLI